MTNHDLDPGHDEILLALDMALILLWNLIKRESKHCISKLMLHNTINYCLGQQNLTM